MKKLLFILFIIPLVSKSQIRTRYHFPDPVVIIDTGPNTAVMSAPMSATNNLSGLITGVYVFRLQVMDNGGSEGSNKTTITVNL